MGAIILQTLTIVMLLLVLTAIIIVGLGNAITPLCIAIAISYLFFPLVKQLESYRIKRELAIGCILLLAIGLLALSGIILIPYIITEIQAFIAELPHNTANAMHALEAYAADLGFIIPLNKKSVMDFITQYKSQLSVETLMSIGGVVKSFFSNLLASLLTMLNIFLIPIFFCYVISDYENLRKQTLSMIPAQYHPTIRRYTLHFNGILTSFIRGQLMVALILAVLFSIALHLVGLKYGLIIGLITGLLSFIPFVGFAIGAILAILILLATSSPLSVCIYTALIFGIINGCENFILIPKFIGNKLNISALTTILALIIGGNLAGMIGIILAIPIACMLKYTLIDVKRLFLYP